MNSGDLFIKELEDPFHILKNGNETPSITNYPKKDSKVLLIGPKGPFINDLISKCLKQNEVIIAYTRYQGYLLALQKQPEIIVCEINMAYAGEKKIPVLLKEDTRTSHIPVILFSEKGSKSDHIKALEAGADAFVRDPFDGQILNLQIQNLNLLQERIRKHQLTFDKNPIHIHPKTTNAENNQLLEKIKQLIEHPINNEPLSILQLSKELGLSRTQLHCKVKYFSGMSTSSFIRTIRLKRALELLQQNTLPIAEVAYLVGFSSPSYFSECFHNFYGFPPSLIGKGKDESVEK